MPNKKQCKGGRISCGSVSLTRKVSVACDMACYISEDQEPESSGYIQPLALLLARQMVPQHPQTASPTVQKHESMGDILHGKLNT